MLQLEQVKVVRDGRTLLSVPFFQLAKGDILGIMGPNGAGKSTLLKTCALLEEPSEGTVYLNDTVVNARHLPLEERRKLAVVLQKSLLLQGTVWKNVAIGLELRKLPKAIIKEKVDHILKRLQLTHLAHAQASHLSGGEAGRLNLARALVLEPAILFLDEPFAALDYPTKVTILKDLKSILLETNTATFLISHDRAEIQFLTDQLAIIMNGEIQQIGATKEVFLHPTDATSHFFQEWELPV